jgi:hypothetical protein
VTIFEFAIAREVYRLVAEEAKRKLTEKEERLLDALSPIVRRLEIQEWGKDARANSRAAQRI